MFQNKVSNIVRSSLIRLGSVRNAATQTEPARMEKSINNVTLLGRVGAEPQKRGNNEHPVVVFSLATHSNYRYETGEFMQKTEWHRVSVFKPSLRDTVINFMKKGQRVHVTGRLTYGEVKGEDGNPRPTATIVADDIIFFQSHDFNKS